ncbi:MAG: hypothetical protein ACLPWO_05665 [Thermoplasmata archaeon]
MADWFNAVTWGVLGALSALNLLVLLYRTERGARIRPWVLRTLQRVSRRDDLRWLDWQPLLVAAGIAFACVSAYGILSGQYGCRPGGSDPISVLNSGKAFWAGQNPFTIPECGHSSEVPYGLAAVLITALGSLGGLPGIYLVWGLVVLAVVPLTWAVAGPDRRYVTVFVGTSVLFVPIVCSQIDGATNAIVPVTVLLSLYLARRSELLSAAVGGFLSTARFPNLLPILGETGSFPRRRYLSFLTAVAVFGGVTGLAFVVWGHEFLDPVFLQQLGRRSFSLNLYGILLLSNALPGGLGIELVQGALTVALLVAVFFGVRSPAAAVSILLVGFALLTPFLSFTILIWLLPVAILGTRARWWLWGVAFVGSLNYDLALNVWAWDDGVNWPSMIFDVVLTLLLLGLFVDLWRGERAAREGRAAARQSPQT